MQTYRSVSEMASHKVFGRGAVGVGPILGWGLWGGINPWARPTPRRQLQDFVASIGYVSQGQGNLVCVSVRVSGYMSVGRQPSLLGRGPMLLWSISVLSMAAVDLLATHLHCEVWLCSQRFHQEGYTDVYMWTVCECVQVIIWDCKCVGLYQRGVHVCRCELVQVGM